MQTVEFTLSKLSVTDFQFPPDMKTRAITNDEVMWNYSYRIRFNPQSPGAVFITITMQYKLYYKSDASKKTIAMVELENIYLVRGTLNTNEKTVMLLNLLPMINNNLQGVYAAKTEGSPLALVVPPVANYYTHGETLNKLAHDHWN